MSAASRERQRFLHLRRGYPTWKAFFAAQRATAAKWVETPEMTLQWQNALVRDAYGRVSQPPRRFGDAFRDMMPALYPEPVDDSPEWDLTMGEDVVGLTT